MRRLYFAISVFGAISIALSLSTCATPGSTTPTLPPTSEISSIPTVTIYIPAEYAHSEVLTDVSWVADHINDPTVRIVDARNPLEGALYDAGHIPGAVFINVFSDVCCPSEIMSAESFSEVMNRFGIGDDTTVVIYDNDGGLWAARLWWALRYYGHEQVKLLNGGLTQWVAQQKTLATEPPEVKPASFHAKTQADWLVSIDQVKSAIDDPDVAILDALMRPSYTGDLNTYDQPGHIATALSLPAPDTIDPISKTILPPEDLSRILMRLKLDPEKSAITYCGGGYYGAHAAFVLYLMGFDDVALYDGSLMEWTSDPSNPMETEP